VSLKNRVGKLEAGLPGEPPCCLEGLEAYREIVQPHFDSLAEHLTLEPPPADPPVLPLAGVCRKTGEPLCALALARVALIWNRRRSLAVAFVGIEDDTEPGR
jgi:hypothetical protein